MSTVAADHSRVGPAGRNQFGTFGGVFTPCILTILGVILFMRANFVVGQVGILGALLILFVAKAITFSTALSTSAIATNMQVRGGGAYYLISRVLGPEFGGAIGIMLFLAQGVSVPFYVLGFSEALVQTLPLLKPHFAAIAIGTAAILFIITYVGARWAIKVQYVIMTVLGLAIAMFMGGAVLRFSPQTFADNWGSLNAWARVHQQNVDSLPFWQVFAIYFPAVTGIMAGINMSGDLKEPARSIPRGTLMAIVVGLAVYAAQLLICGGAFERADLIERPYLLLTGNALFGAAYLVAAGMFAATLSSGLGSYMGAPRVLQAVARDRILSFIKPLARGSARADEPRRALVVTGVLTLGVLVWATRAQGENALNLVAEMITEFFLYTYGMLNVAAFIEAVGENPSFRPRFRFFHWGTALLGSVGCIAVAFVINPIEAVAAFGLLAILVWHMRTRELRAAFGDARRGFVYKAVRDNLIRLMRMKETAKNWRPTCLVFSGRPETRESLVDFAVWFESGRGIVFLANVLVGTFEEYGPRRDAAVAQLRDFCEKRRIEAFPVVMIDKTLEGGMSALLQVLSIGPIRPTVTVFGWSDDPERVPVLVNQFRLASSLDMSLVVVCEGQNPIHYGRKRVDIWWRGMKNGGLMVLLAHLLTRNWEWSRTELRLMREVDSSEALRPTLQDLRQLIQDARIEAGAKVVVSDRPFVEVLHEESSDADCVFLGFEIPDEEQEAEWHRMYTSLLQGMPTTILVCSTGQEGLLA